jgi:mannitol-1-/sugar-/sorbitol-6-phosphatase
MLEMATPDFVLALRRKIGNDLLFLSGVTAVVLKDNEVLLVRGAESGAWTPVTGIIDPGEEPADAAVRETYEEASIRAVPEKLAMVQALAPAQYDNGDHAQFLDLVFKLRWRAGAPHPADGENTDARWFSLDQLPDMPQNMLTRVQAAVADTPETTFSWAQPTTVVQEIDEPRGFSASAAAALFDMDGTLVDSTSVVEGVWAEFAQQHHLDLSELLDYAHGRRTMETVERFLPEGQNVELATSVLDEKQLTRVDGIVEIPGASRLLRQLAGTPMAIVTSAPRQLALNRLRAAGLHAPEVLVAAEDVRTGKPSPEGYLEAARRLGVLPNECIVFEDAEAGLLAANRSGVQRTVVVGRHASSTTTALDRILDYTNISINRNGRMTTFTQKAIPEGVDMS